jgi:hypothetical protein
MPQQTVQQPAITKPMVYQQGEVKSPVTPHDSISPTVLVPEGQLFTVIQRGYTMLTALPPVEAKQPLPVLPVTTTPTVPVPDVKK